MERLTERDKNGTAMAVCCGSECEYNYCCEASGFSECRGIDDIIDRLAAYEETGLEPEGIKGMQHREIMRVINMAPELEGVPFDRLRELAQADREGRVVVLDERKAPCDLCVYNPPSSLDGKPCTMRPAAAKDYEAVLGGGGDD